MGVRNPRQTRSTRRWEGPLTALLKDSTVFSTLTWLIVTTVVEDPEYLTQEFVISSQFKKEPDTSKWSPRPCEIPDPAVSK
jgi:hypothetical protein